jgi:protein-tyrosine phosphatase
MVKVLFVCLGNICRSPLAEGVFDYFIDKQDLNEKISSDSAGTADYHVGSSPDKRSIHTAANHGIILKHRGRKLTYHDFIQFDLIAAMDENNFKDIVAMKNQSGGSAKIVMFRDFDPNGNGDVPDPYHGSLRDFEEVYRICERTCPNLLKHLKMENYF